MLPLVSTGYGGGARKMRAICSRRLTRNAKVCQPGASGWWNWTWVANAVDSGQERCPPGASFV